MEPPTNGRPSLAAVLFYLNYDILQRQMPASITFGKIGLEISVSPMFIFVIAGLILTGWLIFTTIVRYHWKNYGTGGTQIFAMNFFYIAGSAILGGLMILFAVSYFISAQ